MKPRYTASALERVIECPASVLLPQVWKSTPDSQRGGSIHKFVRRVLVGVPASDALALVEPKWRDTCRNIDIAALGGDLHDVRAEVAYAWDLDERTARCLGENIDRAYDVTEREIPGSNDIEGVRMDGVPVAGDIKTGQPVTSCSENPQILYHVMVRQQQTGADEAQGRIWYIGEDGSVHADVHTFGRFDLEDFAATLVDTDEAVTAAAAELAETGRVPVAKGPWCGYCPAMQACPAWTGVAKRSMVEMTDLRDRLEVLTPEEQGRAWALGKEMETLAEIILDGLKKIAKQTPIVLPDGSTVKPLAYLRNDFNRSAAIKLLRDKGATSPEIATLYKRHPVEQVRRFAPPKARRPRKLKAGAGPMDLPALPPAELDEEAVDVFDSSGFDMDDLPSEEQAEA